MPHPLVQSSVAMVMFLAGGSSPEVRAAPLEEVPAAEVCFVSGELPSRTIADEGGGSDAPQTRHFPGIPACERLTVAGRPGGGKALLLARKGLPEWLISLSGDWSGRVHRTGEECRAKLAGGASAPVQFSTLTRGPGAWTIDFVPGGAPGRPSIADAVAAYSPSLSLGREMAIWPQVGAGVYIARSLPQFARARDRMRIDKQFDTDRFSPGDTRPPASPQSAPSRDLGHRSRPCAPLRIVEMAPDTLVVTEIETQSGNIQTYSYSAGAGWKEVTFRTEEECLGRLKERPLDQDKEGVAPVEPP